MFSEIIANSAWYYFILAIIISAAISLYLYFKNKKNAEVPKLILNSLFLLRFLSFFVITLLLLNVFVKRLSNETENPLVLLAIDNSKSMISLKDSDEIKGQFLEDLKAFKGRVSKNYQVKTVLFGSKSETSDQAPLFDAKETDFSELFNTLETNYSNQNIGALIIVSDGIYNKGANPLYTSLSQNYPIYSIAIGDTSQFRDIAIQKINHNQITYLGNQFPVEVIVNAKKYLNETIQIGIYEKGKVLTQTKLKINSSNFLSALNFTLSAEQTGLSNYTVKVGVLEGEKNTLNNVQSFAIEVIDSKEKILILANSPHPDIAAFKDVITNSSNYELEFSLFKDFNKTLKAYNLVILHGINESHLKYIEECKINKLPIWIVAPQKPSNLPGVQIKALDSKFNDAEAVFEKSFGLFNISPELKSFVNEFPAITTFFGNYKLNNGANSLFKQRIGSVETENPILFFTESEGVKNGVFIGDGLWRWRMRDFSENKNQVLFNELITKCIQYLTVKEDKSFFRVYGPKLIDENERIEFEAEVYNKSYELVTDAEVSFVMRNSENKKYDYTFSKIERSYKLELGLLPAGRYSYESTVKQNNELYRKEGVFIVREVMAEKINTVANHELLFQISEKSGGNLYYSKDLKVLEEELLKNENIKPITYTRKNTQSIIEFIWIFWVILFLLSLEWYFRKRYLSI